MKLIKNKRFIIYIIMAGWIILVSNYNKKHTPLKMELSNLNVMNTSLMQNIGSLANYTSDIEKRKMEIVTLKQELKKINIEYEKLGALIPKKGNIDQFLKYLTYEEKAKDILFKVITPAKDSKTERDKKRVEKTSSVSGIETHVYELKIFGYYSDIYNYIKYLEKLSHFGGVVKTRIIRDVKDKTDRLEALIWFSLIISDEEVKNRETTFNVSSKGRVKKLKSPFLKFETKKEVKAVTIENILPEFEISGIISNRNENRVIINQQIYKAGDTIDKSIILKIDKDKVIFKTDSIEHEISIS